MRRLIFLSTQVLAATLLLLAMVQPAAGQAVLRGGIAADGKVSDGVRAPDPNPGQPVFQRRFLGSQPQAPPADDSDNRGGDRSPDGRKPDSRRDGHRDHDRHGHHHRQRWNGGGFPNGGGFGYPAVWPWGLPYASFYSPYNYYPAATMFGYNFTIPTDPVPNFNNNPALWGQANGVANLPAPAPAAKPAVPVDPPKVTNPQQLALAGRFVGYGDRKFEQQKYLAALGRYKTAVETAPDMADGYLRQAFAHVALGQYEYAAKAFKRALLIRDDWRGSPFRLSELYVDSPIAKTQHLENLAAAVEENPFDGDLLLTLGLELYFDGQRERAAVFLSRVAQFGGDEAPIKYFLQQPKPDGAPDQPPAKPARPGKVVF